MGLRMAIVLVCAAVVAAYGEDQKPAVKHVAAPQTSAASGKQMFEAYCASCHGASG